MKLTRFEAEAAAGLTRLSLWVTIAVFVLCCGICPIAWLVKMLSYAH